MQIKSKHVQPKTSPIMINSFDYSQIIERIQTIGTTSFPITLVTKERVLSAISVSLSTLKHYRKCYWLEGIHYFYLSPRTIRYSLELILDWSITRSNPQAHQRSIEAFLTKLESNRSTKKRRRKTR